MSARVVPAALPVKIMAVTIPVKKKFLIPKKKDE